MQASLTYAVDGLAFQVKFDRWDSLQNDRANWEWTIRETTRVDGESLPSGEILATGTDLTTVGEAIESKALNSLAGFLSAWCDAVRAYDGESRPENLDLFPDKLLTRVDVDTWDQLAEGLGQATGGWGE